MMHFPTSPSWLPGWALCLALATGLFAQEAKKTTPPEKEEKLSNLSAYVSVVALGPVPQRKYKMPDDDDLEDIDAEAGDGGDSGRPERKNQPDSGAGDIPILLPPIPGSTPPGALYYKSPDSPAEGNPWSRIRVGYNNATSITPVPAGITLQLHQTDRDKNSGYQSYISIPAMVPASQVIIFLTPGNKGTRPWRKDPRISVLNIRSQALRDKNVLVRNFSSKSVAVKFAKGAPDVLRPGQRKSFKLENKGRYTAVAAIIASSRKPLVNTAVRLPKDTLTVLAFYDADRVTNGGKSVGVFRTTVSKLPPEVLNKERASARQQ